MGRRGKAFHKLQGCRWGRRGCPVLWDQHHSGPGEGLAGGRGPTGAPEAGHRFFWLGCAELVPRET